MKQSIVRMLLCAGALLPESVVLAEDLGEASLTVSGPTTETGAEEHDKAATSNAASAATPDMAAQLAALQRQLDAMKEDMETQKALAEAGNRDQLTAKTDIFRLYGWMDMGFNKTWVDSRDSLNVMLPTKGGTFVLGNINLYFDIQPSENWSSLVDGGPCPLGPESVARIVGTAQQHRHVLGRRFCTKQTRELHARDASHPKISDDQGGRTTERSVSALDGAREACHFVALHAKSLDQHVSR
jgi:hypothetical protein